jgi:hypothetical protein
MGGKYAKIHPTHALQGTFLLPESSLSAILRLVRRWRPEPDEPACGSDK